MSEIEANRWWDPAATGYDRGRAEQLRDSLLGLIERDIAFSLNALTQGYCYPGDIRLDVSVIEQDDDGEEPADDWFFTLEGPTFKVVLLATGCPDVALDARDITILREPWLDEVEGEAPALAWLAAPPMPATRGYK